MDRIGRSALSRARTGRAPVLLQAAAVLAAVLMLSLAPAVLADTTAPAPAASATPATPVLSAQPAAADVLHVTAAPHIGLSRDRLGWSSDLDATLFLPDLAWAPGEVRASAFFVRNDGTTPTSLVVLATRRADPAAAEPAAGAEGAAHSPDQVAMSVQVDDGLRTELLPGASTTALTTRVLQPGRSATVTVRAGLGPDAASDTRPDLSLLAVRVQPPAPAPDDDSWSAARLQLAPVFLLVALGCAFALRWRARRPNRSRRPRR